MSQVRTWLITGCSTGLGKALAEQLLARGERVIATARDTAKIEDLRERHEANVLTRRLDVTNPQDVETAIAAARDRFGPIDVLVNNAGYGHVGSVEEVPLDAARLVMETNFFASWRLIQAVLPEMRARRRGWIVNIASVNGLVAAPMAAAYCATKFALMGLTEALRGEVDLLGIKVTGVAPGPIDTDFSTRSLLMTAPATQDYDIPAAYERAGMGDWQQTGDDPARGAAAIIAALDTPEPPLHLILGSKALDFTRRHYHDRLDGFERWADHSLMSHAS